MVNKVRNVPTESSIDSEWAISIIVVKVKKVGSAFSIVDLPTTFSFFTGYYLKRIREMFKENFSFMALREKKAIYHSEDVIFLMS